MINFIKISRYETSPAGVDVFDYLSRVTIQQIDPPTLMPHHLLPEEDFIFYSTLKRAIGCIKVDPVKTYVGLSTLREIPFDLKKICPRDEWMHEGSVVVRRRFKEAFIGNELLVNRSRIFQEIRNILAMCKKESNLGDVAVISHSFRMKLVEAFIRTEGEIESHPDLINDFILDDKKTYGFEEGFTV